MDSVKVTICSIFNILVLIQVPSSAQPSPLCSGLISLAQLCANSPIPDSGNWDALISCSAAENTAGCDDSLALKIIDHQTKAFQMTKKFFTDGSYSSELTSNNSCMEMVSRVRSNWVRFAPGFLTDKGCRYFKTMVITAGLSLGNTQCEPMIEDYINMLYSATSCSNVVVNTPTKDDAKNIDDGLYYYETCLTSHQIKCSSGKSERLQCVEDKTMNKINNPNLKYLEKNMVDIVGNTDKLFCEDANLRKEFDKTPSCYKYVNQLNNRLLDQVNGFRTAAGCEGMKYVDHFTVAIFGDSCGPLLQKYLDKMMSRLPCSDFAVKINATSYLLIVLISISAMIGNL